jgi:hypothetical protein
MDAQSVHLGFEVRVVSPNHERINRPEGWSEATLRSLNSIPSLILPNTSLLPSGRWTIEGCK